MTLLLGAIRLALSAIVRNKLRAALTVLGILIGVTAVVMVTALAGGASASVGDQIDSFASNALFINPETVQQSGVRAKATGRLTENDGKAIARERLERARIEGAEWVVLFEDVTPLGSQRLEMHVASGRALHASSDLPLDASRPTFTLQVVQLDPADGAWLLDAPPLMPERKYDTREEWDARMQQARSRFGRG